MEDRYGVDLDEAALTGSATVADIEKLVRSKSEKASIDRFSYPRWPLRFPVSWIRPVFYELVIYPITRLLGGVSKRGVEHLNDVKGPVIFVSNHVTYVDPALVMSAMPRKFRRRLAIAMDGERLRGYLHPPHGTPILERIRMFFTYWLVVVFFNAFPVPRRSGFRESFSFAGEAMDRGYNILIFPEGELTKDGSVQPFKSGIGILAEGLEAPIVPVAITGLYDLRARGQRGYAKKGSVTVRFGQPIPFNSEWSTEKITRELESKVRELQIPAP
jgi:long-chain acyl-CoA synthetase